MRIGQHDYLRQHVLRDRFLGAPSSNSALCADASAVRASLDKLRHVEVTKGMANEITADLDDVKAALTTFVNDAHGQYKDQTSALCTALGMLKTSVSALAANPSSRTVSGVKAAVAEVNTAGQNLLAAVNPKCPSASHQQARRCTARPGGRRSASATEQAAGSQNPAITRSTFGHPDCWMLALSITPLATT